MFYVTAGATDFRINEFDLSSGGSRIVFRDLHAVYAMDYLDGFSSTALTVVTEETAVGSVQQRQILQL